MSELTRLCRICFKDNVKMYNLNENNLKEQYFQLLGFKDHNDDCEFTMPQSICYLCLHSLRRALSFRQHSLSAEACLKNYLLYGQELPVLELPYANLTPSIIERSQDIILIAEPAENAPMMPENEPTKPEVKLLDVFDVVVKEEAEEKPVRRKKKMAVAKNKKIRKKAEPPKYEVYSPDITDLPKLEAMSDSEDEVSLSTFKEKLLSGEVIGAGEVKARRIAPVKRELPLKDVSTFAEEISLTLQEQIEEVTKRKDTEQYQVSLYKCTICYIGYNHKVTYDRHMRKHDESTGDWVCPVCSIRKTDKYKLAKHRLAAHDKKFKCRECGHVSNTSTQARAHYRWHNGFTYQCQFCGKTFRHPTTFLSHVRKTHPSQFVCDICGERFINPSGVNMHKIKAHGFDGEKAKDAGPYCAECDIRFTNVEAYSRHMVTSSNHGQGFHECKYCGRSFGIKTEMQGHSRLCRIANQRSPKPNGGVVCKECGAKLRDGIAYRMHVSRYHRPAGSVNATPDAAAPASASVECDLCDRTFVCKAKMRYHRRSHTGEKPFLCPTCNKSFSALHSVRDHMRTHTGERPFTCDKCHKSFVSKSGLYRHQLVHSGARPYGCPQCGKKFSQSNAVKLHVHTVHMKLPAPYVARKRQRSAQIVENA